MLDKIDRLFEEQTAEWPMLAQGLASLKEAQTRTVDVNGYTVRIRHLPHRITSTTAAVDPESIAKRPCFLCAENMPPQQRGLHFNSELTIYCNPFPILDRHMTIVHREHHPQRIKPQIGNMIALADALPGHFVIYNGPQCGASAPDHMHFQACSTRDVPIVDDVERARGETIPNYGRRVILFRDSDRNRLIGQIDRTVDILSTITRKHPEPLINIAVTCNELGWTVYLFPRGKHRPHVFHTGELTVSPAAIDLCGIFVVPLEKDFAHITGDDIASIFREVTLSDDIFNEVAAEI